jgi:hypothetical protein
VADADASTTHQTLNTNLTHAQRISINTNKKLQHRPGTRARWSMWMPPFRPS